MILSKSLSASTSRYRLKWSSAKRSPNPTFSPPSLPRFPYRSTASLAVKIFQHRPMVIRGQTFFRHLVILKVYSFWRKTEAAVFSCDNANIILVCTTRDSFNLQARFGTLWSRLRRKARWWSSVSTLTTTRHPKAFRSAPSYLLTMSRSPDGIPSIPDKEITTNSAKYVVKFFPIWFIPNSGVSPNCPTQTRTIFKMRPF